MQRKYDVIIIGAGPAGLKCAEQFIDSKMSVLIIEKSNIIGPKPCGGGLTGLFEKNEISDKALSFSHIYATLSSKSNKIRLFTPIITIDRSDLGKFQLKKIKNIKNIKILKNTRVEKVDGKKIDTNKGKFYFKYLVGAEGTHSLTRKYLGLKSKICVGILYKVPLKTNRLIWNFYPNLLKSGYLWVFPHIDHTNIGVYFDPDFVNAKKAKKVLEDYLIKNEFDFDKKEIEGGSVNYNYQKCVFDNIFLVGDAAGLTSKIWGEGIPYAMVSGEEIGKKILNPNYSMPKLKKIIKIKNRQDRISFFIDKFPILQKYFMKLWIILISYYWFQNYFGIIENIHIKPHKKRKIIQQKEPIAKWINLR